VTLRGRLTTAFLAVVLGPVLLGAAFVGVTVSTVGHDRADERLDHAAASVRTAIGALCRQLQATADALAVLPDDAARRDAADQFVARGLASGVLVADAGGATVTATAGSPAQPWTDCATPGTAGVALAAGAEIRDLAGAVLGTVRTAQLLDAALIDRLAGVGGAAVTFLDGPRLSSEPADRRDPVLDLGTRLRPDTTDRVGGRQVRRLVPAPGQPLALAVSVPSVDPRGLYGLLAAAVLGTAALAVVAATLLARSTTRTLAEVAAAADRVASGDLATRVPVVRQDEIGRLAGSFNRMTRELQSYIHALTTSRDQLRRHLRVLGDTLSSTHDLQRILRVIVDSATAATGARSGIVLLVDPVTGELAGRAGQVESGSPASRRTADNAPANVASGRHLRWAGNCADGRAGRGDGIDGRAAGDGVEGGAGSGGGDVRTEVLGGELRTVDGGGPRLADSDGRGGAAGRRGRVGCSDPVGSLAVVRASVGVGSGDRPDVDGDGGATVRLPLGVGLLGTVALTGESQLGRAGDGTVLTPDEPHGDSWVAVPICAPALEEPGRGAARPAAIGVLALYDRPGGDEFDDGDLETLRTFAAQAGVAVHNVRLHEEAQRLSLTDPLTGLWNYRYLQESIRREVERASRFGRMLSVLALDLDHFKDVNDTYGHAAGDIVLVEFARRIKSCLREVDLAFRQGGEEFVVLLPETDAYGGATAAERLGSAVRATAVPIGVRRPGLPDRISISVSVGIAVYPHHGLTASGVLEAADDALYMAKAAGRDTYRLAGQPANVGPRPDGERAAGGAPGGPHPPRQSRGR
jgi:two-component system cell cycle response regulator